MGDRRWMIAGVCMRDGLKDKRQINERSEGNPGTSGRREKGMRFEE